MKSHKKIKNMIVFAMLGAILFAGKIVFEAVPNIHPVACLIMVYTVVYRRLALIPIYIFVFLFGLFYGFSTWWLPYLYIWTVLWGMTMLLPKNMPPKIAMVVYPVICGLFGLLYGTFYAPAQAILFHFNFKTTLAWIASGLPFDALHGIGNLAMGILIYPLSKALSIIDKNYSCFVNKVTLYL
ncbi:MAG: hypothetical protein E7672_08580 [Ruminococcaceae bacterium]|nr:hypothetical protein [Oscillospiraceae bacterium]